MNWEFYGCSWFRTELQVISPLRMVFSFVHCAIFFWPFQYDIPFGAVWCSKKKKTKKIKMRTLLESSSLYVQIKYNCINWLYILRCLLLKFWYFWSSFKTSIIFLPILLTPFFSSRYWQLLCSNSFNFDVSFAKKRLEWTAHQKRGSKKWKGKPKVMLGWQIKKNWTNRIKNNEVNNNSNEIERRQVPKWIEGERVTKWLQEIAILTKMY